MENELGERTTQFKPFEAQELAVRHLKKIKRQKKVVWIKISALIVIALGLAVVGWLIFH